MPINDSIGAGSTSTNPGVGFAIPVSRWFRGQLKNYLEEMLLSDRAMSRGLFVRATVERYLAENAAGQKDHSYRLWALLMLEQDIGCLPVVEGGVLGWARPRPIWPPSTTMVAPSMAKVTPK